jgi:hypothetical protein
MSLLIWTMLSAGSLAAFTASAPQARPIRVSAVGGTGPTTRFRPGQPPSPAPGNMPRGSLLDLAV